jgi:hypothetical protein
VLVTHIIITHYSGHLPYCMPKASSTLLNLEGWQVSCSWLLCDRQGAGQALHLSAFAIDKITKAGLAREMHLGPCVKVSPAYNSTIAGYYATNPRPHVKILLHIRYSVSALQ